MSSARGGHGDKPPFLAHHFDTPLQQHESGKLGMWIFLSQEVLFFSGVFCVYAVYRSNHPEIFAYAHRFLSVPLGALNTVVLITSSLTAAFAVRSAQLGKRRQLIWNLAATLALALTFLGVKAIEYEHKWKDGLLWGKHYAPTAEVLEGAHPSPRTGARAPGAAALDEAERRLLAEQQVPPAEVAAGPEQRARAKPSDEPRNVQMFFAIYFVMTGLHGLHVLAGIAVFLWLLRRALRGDFGPQSYTAVDGGALYWHLVDLVWIYLFPLLYLIS